MMTMYDNFKPKRPIIYTKIFEQVLPVRPMTLGNSKVVNKETYEAIMNCVSFDGKTKSCTPEEWKKNSFYLRTEQSMMQ